MKEVTLYSADWCPYCLKAKRLLDSKGIAYKEINVDQHPNLRQEISEKTGFKTIPQIFIGDRFVGGYTDLAALETSGELDQIVKN